MKIIIATSFQLIFRIAADEKEAFNTMHGVVGLIMKTLQYRNMAVVEEKDVTAGIMDYFKRVKDRHERKPSNNDVSKS